MSRRVLSLLAGTAAIWLAVLSFQLGALPAPQAASLVINYPLDGSLFPPDFAPPTFLWHDSDFAVKRWTVDVDFDGRGPGLHIESSGPPPSQGEIDPRAVSATNRLPAIDPALHSWKPDAATWERIKQLSTQAPATFTITGSTAAHIAVRTATDPVGAPIFYRDVPLMPSEAEKGVIKPLAPAAIPLIAWRLKYVNEPGSRLLMEGLHTCTNCHSFSRDGKTMGVDVDGPQNDKGTYAIAAVQPRMSIGNQDVITWNDFPAKLPGNATIGFLSQISPDGRYAVTTLNEELYVSNFTDYRFLQVFYPTRGILAIYDRTTDSMKALPGADDPRYVQTDGVWSPDGKYLVFARAVARDANPAGSKVAAFAGDPQELPVRYDLYRIPFNNGAGGRAEPIKGASANGMSNTFPKVSPDGRWIVFVKCRNGQLMRPDSELFIVPTEGGAARRMTANTPLMNSWHSFSPNGRWLVFASKSRSPYTQMFLTHLDKDGIDTPAILVENATAANRAINIPEFVNIPVDGLLHISVPAAEFYRLFDAALELESAGKHRDAVAEWTRALAIDTNSAKARTNLGIALTHGGNAAAALVQFRQAVRLDPAFAEARNNLAVALVQAGAFEEALTHFRAVLRSGHDDPRTRNNFAVALLSAGRAAEALPQFERLLQANPNSADLHANSGRALVQLRRIGEAIAHFQRAIELDPYRAEWHFDLGDAFYSRQQLANALNQWREGLKLDPTNVTVLNFTAWTLATSSDAAIRNGVEAVALAESAMKASGGREPAIYDALAAAYAEAGRFEEAVKTAQAGRDLVTPLTDPRVSSGLEARLALYRKRSPFRVK